MIKLMYVTADPATAQRACAAGVDRVFVDLEYINKAERQRGRDTLVSANTIDDVSRVRAAVPDADLLVRVNPLSPASGHEVEAVVARGADIVMLPMVMDADDAGAFVSAVSGRARTCLLLETPQSLVRMDTILDVAGVDEIYIGLNDMHIGMGLQFMFELLSGGIVEYMAAKARERGVPFGFGGVARIGDGALPAEAILGEHYRLGSSSVILSRAFRGESGLGASEFDLAGELERLRACEREIADWGPDAFEANRLTVIRHVSEIVGRQ